MNSGVGGCRPPLHPTSPATVRASTSKRQHLANDSTTLKVVASTFAHCRSVWNSQADELNGSPVALIEEPDSGTPSPASPDSSESRPISRTGSRGNSRHNFCTMAALPGETPELLDVANDVPVNPVWFAALQQSRVAASMQEPGISGSPSFQNYPVARIRGALHCQLPGESDQVNQRPTTRKARILQPAVFTQQGAIGDPARLACSLSCAEPRFQGPSNWTELPSATSCPAFMMVGEPRQVTYLNSPNDSLDGSGLTSRLPSPPSLSALKMLEPPSPSSLRSMSLRNGTRSNVCVSSQVLDPVGNSGVFGAGRPPRHRAQSSAALLDTAATSATANSRVASVSMAAALGAITSSGPNLGFVNSASQKAKHADARTVAQRGMWAQWQARQKL